MLGRIAQFARKAPVTRSLAVTRSMSTAALNVQPSYTKTYNIAGYEVVDPDTNKNHFVKCTDIDAVFNTEPANFNHQAALLVAFAANGKDPVAYLRNVVTLTHPRNMNDALVLDFILSYWGLEKGTANLPASNLVSAARLDFLFNELAKEFNKPGFDADFSNFKKQYQEKLDSEEVNDDAFVYYKTLIVGLPLLAACIFVSYSIEFSHINHMKHEQMDRVTGKSSHH